MKKLMIAAAVVCAAVAANAAALSWNYQTTGVQYAIPATTVANGLEYNTSYDAGTTKLKGNSSFSNVYIQIVLTSQDDSTLTDTITTEAKYMTSGNIKTDTLTSSIVNDTDRGKKYNYVITISADVVDGKQKTMGATATLTGVWTVQTSGNAGLKTAAAGSWTTTPEPTSGLLLLLGVAGLALRRKQK